MSSREQFVKELEEYVNEKLSSLDLIKETEIPASDRAEIVRRLKMALKNELEASELAALWMPTTPEIEVKLALARQAGDEAKHYRLIEKHLENMGVDLHGFDPLADGYGPMFQLLAGFKSTVERIGAAQPGVESPQIEERVDALQFVSSRVKLLASHVGG